jgi:hypothetical protein
LLAFTLALLFVVLLAQVATHSHEKGQNKAACQTCQAAHLGSTPASGVLSTNTPLLAFGFVQSFTVTFYKEFFFHDSPSRAPPSFLA